METGVNCVFNFVCISAPFGSYGSYGMRNDKRMR